MSTDSTGPKISSRAMRMAAGHAVNIVGRRNQPRSGSGHGASYSSAPSSTPDCTSSRMRVELRLRS